MFPLKKIQCCFQLNLLHPCILLEAILAWIDFLHHNLKVTVFLGEGADFDEFNNYYDQRRACRLGQPWPDTGVINSQLACGALCSLKTLRLWFLYRAVAPARIYSNGCTYVCGLREHNAAISIIV
jgi:hypothetical protein